MARELKPCGTVAAYMRHGRQGEPVCDACIRAWREYKVARRGGYKKLPDLMPCGTEAAYRRHLRNDEEPCAACRAAVAACNYKRRAARATEQAA